jgi:hypothetical protein
MSSDPIRPSQYTELSGYTVPADLIPPPPARIDALGGGRPRHSGNVWAGTSDPVSP